MRPTRSRTSPKLTVPQDLGLIHTPLRSRSFDFHLEALMLVYRNRMAIKEIPITYVYSNSSLNWKVIRDAFRMWVLMMRSRGV